MLWRNTYKLFGSNVHSVFSYEEWCNFELNNCFYIIKCVIQMYLFSYLHAHMIGILIKIILFADY